jgi:hypothetical protein
MRRFDGSGQLAVQGQESLITATKSARGFIENQPYVGRWIARRDVEFGLEA